MIKEHHTLSNYVRYRTEASKILPGKFVSIPVFRCPRCSKEKDPPKHGEVFWCSGCKLEMQAHGNSLTIWADEHTAVNQQ